MSYCLLISEIKWNRSEVMAELDKMEYGLSQRTLSLIKGVFKKHPQVSQVLIYGSRAKGTYRLGSDIDLILKGKDIALETLFKIENELDELLLLYKFDVSIYDKITDCDILEDINSAGKIIL